MKNRRDIRRRLDQFVANPNCEANVLSAVHDVPMLQVARAEGLEPVASGQSPFAISRGNRFERSLFADDARTLREALVAAGVLPAASGPVVDLRLRSSGGPVPDLDTARARFEHLLHSLADRTERPADTLPALVLAPAIRLPGDTLLPEGMFAIDVLTIHPPQPATPGGPIELRVGEIKVYPDRGGHTDPRELATARAQAGVYVHALRTVIESLGLTGSLRVADDGFLVLSKTGSNWPSVRAGEDLRYQARRAAASFERLRAAAARVLPPDAPGDLVPAARLTAVREAPTSYHEACLSFCERAERCQQRAYEQGDPRVLGADVARLLGGISLARAEALLAGRVVPENPAEQSLVRHTLAASSRRAKAAS